MAITHLSNVKWGFPGSSVAVRLHVFFSFLSTLRVHQLTSTPQPLQPRGSAQMQSICELQQLPAPGKEALHAAPGLGVPGLPGTLSPTHMSSSSQEAIAKQPAAGPLPGLCPRCVLYLNSLSALLCLATCVTLSPRGPRLPAHGRGEAAAGGKADLCPLDHGPGPVCRAEAAGLGSQTTWGSDLAQN